MAGPVVSTATAENARKWYELLKISQNILLTSPASPDGDSIGAQLAMKGLIESHWKGKRVFPYHEEAVGTRYDCLPGKDSFLNRDTADKIPFKDLDLAIVLDGGRERIGDFLEQNLPKSVPFCQIDHHAVEGGYPYRLRWCDPNASSTGELVYHLLKTPPFEASKLSTDIAQALYVSVIFDTGFFRHDCTTPTTLKMASELYEKRIPFSFLAEQTMLITRFEAKKLLGLALNSMELHFHNRVAMARITQDNLRACGATDDDRDGIIEVLFLTRDVEVGMLLYEVNPTRTKVSFRSRTDFDVASFARSLTSKGGGHRKASGCTLELPLKEAREAILNGLGQLAEFSLDTTVF